MKVTKIFLSVTIFLILIISAYADDEMSNGCFFYPDSQLYCLEITLEEAEQECSSFDECNLDQYYFYNQSCSDFSTFPFCDKAVCKSSCQEEFLGKCSGGTVPFGEEAGWCTPGCCRFNYYQNNDCTFQTNQWLCEIEAKNKEAGYFNFDTEFDESTCLEYCQQALLETGDITAGLNLETVSEESLVSYPLPEISQNIFKTETLGEKTAGDQSQERFFSWWLNLLIILAVAGIIYFLYREGFFAHCLERKSISTAEKPKFKIPAYLLYPLLSKKMQKMKEHYRFTANEKKREEFLTEFGLALPEIKDNEIVKLKKLVRGYERKKYFYLKKHLTEGEKAIEKLERLVKQEFQPVKAEILGKKIKEEQKKVIEELRKIIRR